VQHLEQQSNSPGRLLLRRVVHTLWLGFFVVGGILTVFLDAWQGFSPDGPPPGFQPEAMVPFLLKNFPVAFLTLVIQLPWLSFPMLVFMVWDFQEWLRKHCKSQNTYDL
jgi:hypothetical protein